jgi:hypothetical protein
MIHQCSGKAPALGAEKKLKSQAEGLLYKIGQRIRLFVEEAFTPAA